MSATGTKPAKLDDKTAKALEMAQLRVASLEGEKEVLHRGVEAKKKELFSLDEGILKAKEEREAIDSEIALKKQESAQLSLEQEGELKKLSEAQTKVADVNKELNEAKAELEKAKAEVVGVNSSIAERKLALEAYEVLLGEAKDKADKAAVLVSNIKSL